jgi:hypothetical protein
MSEQPNHWAILSESTRKLIIVTIAVALVAVAFGLVDYYQSIRFSGTVRGIGVGVYKDFNCTQPLHSIDIGMVDPGEVKNVTIYVRNKGGTGITLSMQTLNWNPSIAADQIQLNWNYNGQILDGNRTLEVALMLVVSSSLHDITTFSFDAVIAAQQI